MSVYGPDEPVFPGAPTATGYLTTHDGLRLWWQLHGPIDSDATPLVCANGVGVSVFFWHNVVRRFAKDRPILLWDYPGHGRSDLIGADDEISIARIAEDMLLVMKDAGIERGVLAGHSMGVQVNFEAYRRAPQSVAGLVAIMGTAGEVTKTFGGMKDGLPVFDVILHLVQQAGPDVEQTLSWLLQSPRMDGLARLVWQFHPRLAPAADLQRYMQHMSGMSMKTFARMAAALGDHSAWDLLPSIDVPALIIAGQLDTFSPEHLSRKMAEDIPRSEFLMLPDATHAGLIEQPTTINLALRRFLKRSINR